jgi:hypothetical protein
VSPASPPESVSVDHYLELLESWDLRGEVAPHALDRWGYMAGSDADRLEDLNQAFRDPGVRAVIAVSAVSDNCCLSTTRRMPGDRMRFMGSARRTSRSGGF